MTIFDWVNQILVHKKHWNDFTEDEQKKFSPFIINRFLSMDKEFIAIVNFFQKYAIFISLPFQPFWRPKSSQDRPKTRLETIVFQKHRFPRNSTKTNRISIFLTPRSRQDRPKIGPRSS